MVFCLCRRLSFLERRCESSRAIQACCLDESILFSVACLVLSKLCCGGGLVVG